MTRFPLIDDDQARDPLVREVYQEIKRELGFGMVPNLFKSMAIRPTLLRAHWDKFRATVLQGHLPRTLKEMIGVLISQANQSEYAMRVHLHGLSAMGISQEVLNALILDFEHCPLPEREKHILRFGLLTAIDPINLTDEHYTQLRTFNLRDEEIFEIVATADLFSSINTYTDAAAVPIDQLSP